MGTRMSSCDAFEAAIEQRLHGELPEDGARVLADHLVGCASCRAYEANARALDAGLADRAREAHAAVDWTRIEAGIRRRLRARLWKLAVGVAIGVFAVVLATWGFGAPGGTFGVEVGALVSAIVLTRVVVVVREVRSVSSLAAGDELLARHAELLAKQVRSIRRLRWVALAVVAVLAVLAVWATERRQTVTYVTLACVVAATWAHALLVTYPQARRELAELAPDE